MNDLVWIAIGVFVLAMITTAGVRLYAIQKQVLDIPGERSSHSLPTPRGGGLGIVIALITGLGLLSITQGYALFWPVLPGVLLALLCFYDDHGHIGFHYRLLAQTVAVSALLLVIDGAPWLTLFFWPLQDFPLAYLLLVIGVVWFINLFNFMDGINGIAGLESISICFGLLCLALITGYTGGFVSLSLILLAACLGFLVWNFPRARIFMGDVGSVFCGYSLALVILLAGTESVLLFWAGAILAGVFIVDASVTLLVRILRREKIWQAHRSHAYQRAARHYNSHVKVTLMVTLINLCWLLPLAILVTTAQLSVIWGLVIAYAPLVATVIWFGAGRAEVT